MEEDYLSRLQASMTTVRGVNRTDVLIMGRAFKSAGGIMQVPMPVPMLIAMHVVSKRR